MRKDEHGHQDECRNEEHQAAKEHIDRGAGVLLYGLIVTDDGDVQGKEDGGCGKQRQSCRGYLVWPGACMEEKPDERFCPKCQYQCCQHSADGGCAQAELEGLADALVVAGTVIEADDGLRRLRHRIVDHEDDGVEVARHAECCHAVLAQLADEDIVAGKQDHGHCQFSQHGGEAAARHVTDVSGGEIEAGEAELQSADVDGLGTERHVPHYHCRGYGAAER